MNNLEWLIRYDSEGTKLDFKREQYHKGNYQDLIKDIMSMANAPVEGKRYIVVGVKDRPDGTKEFSSINGVDFIDQATYQQIVRENIEPTINFSYYPKEIDEYLLGIFEIDENNNPPYMMRKDYKMLKKGECFIRRGSQQERLTRRDLDEILEIKSKKIFNDKISIGFNNDSEKKLTIRSVREIKLPSQNAKEKIESILKSRKEASRLGLNSAIGELGLSMTRFRMPFESVPYEDREVDELEKNLKNVVDTYNDHDWYYIGEKMSEKLNLFLKNDGNQYLEDVVIKLRIPSEHVRVMDKIHSKPISNPLLISGSLFHESISYPNVLKEAENYIVEENLGDLKHHQGIEAFNENLRVFFRPQSLGEILTWTYTIYAKNLPSPISGELTVEVI